MIKENEKLKVNGRWRIYELSDDYKEKKLVREQNNIPCDGLLGTITALFNGSGDSNDTLECKYLAVGTKNQTPSSAFTTLGTELARKAISDKTITTTTYTGSVIFGKTEGNCTQTTCVTDTTNTVDTFKVATVAGFNVGDELQVGLGTGYEYVAISAKDTTNTTLSVTPSLSTIPPDSTVTVDQLWQEAGCFGNGDADSTANSGHLFNYVTAIKYLKTSANPVNLELVFTVS